MSSCPSLEVLRRFGSGSSLVSHDLALDAHIDDCPDCQEVLDRLAAGISSGEGPAAIDAGKLPRIPGFAMGRELGRGGMGVVFLARELHADREVAVKFLSSGPFASSRDRARWLKEARAAARVRHPNIVQLYRVGEAEGWPYLVMEYLPGGSLKDRLIGPLSPRDAAALLMPVARALEQLDLAGIWHLDLKPANILIDAPPGTPVDRAPLKLADFGIAHLRDDAGTTGTGLAAAPGTLLYMAPEQLIGRRSALGPATDIHAMGVTLYELLTGRPPFLADSAAETIRRIQTEDPVPPRRLNPGVPRDLDVICLTCLEKDQRRRYPSAGALADDLGRWLEGRPIAARPVPLVEKGWKMCRRHPMVAALVATLAITLATGLLTILLLWREAEAARHRAEADYEVGRAALAEILDLGQRSIEPTVVVTRDRFVASLESARTRILQLARTRPDDLAVWNLLAVVDLFLGRNLEFQGRLVEGEALYLESLGYWDRIIARDPGPILPKYRRLQTLECLGRILEQQGKPAESIGYWEQAIAAGESVLPHQATPDLHTMAVCRTALARLLGQRGDHQRAGGLLAANLAMLSRLSPGARTPSTADRLRDTSDELVRIRWEDATTAELSRAIRVADSLPANPEVAANECAAGYRLACQSAELVKMQRDAGRLDESRRTVDRLLIFTGHLVARYPDQPMAHMAHCEAHTQSYKNAWKFDDRASIEGGLRQALREARLALSLDPRDARARMRSVVLEQKLSDLLDTKPDLEQPDPTTSDRLGR